MNRISALAALALTTTLVSTATEAAQPWPNWYVGLTGSVGFLTDSDVSGAGAGVNTGVNYNNPGFGVGGSIGYMPGTNASILRDMRFEGEVFYHKNDIDSIETTGGNVAGLNGISATSYMFNALYALPMSGGALRPYFGGGIGVTSVDLSTSSGLGNTNDKQTKFSYQGLAGLAYSFANLPDVEWTLGYRYLGVQKPSYSTAGGPVKIDYGLHDVEAGLKMRF